MTPRPQPFPFTALPAISRAELRAAKHVRGAATHLVRVDAVAGALAELTGDPVTITVRRTRVLATHAPSADGVAVALTPAEESGLDHSALIDVEGALASALVARALRQRAPRVLDPARGPAPEIAGAVAALLHATLRRAHAGTPLRIVAAGPAVALARDLAARHPSVVTAWLTVVLGGDAFDARVSIPEALLDRAPTDGRGLTTDVLASLGDAPLALPLVAATCLADRRTLGALRTGDAFLLPTWPLQRSGELFCGRVALVPPRAERGLAADLGEDGRLMLRSGPPEAHSWDRQIGGSMSGENPTLEVLEDAPVVVRVELGTVEMTAREWASLAPGDVVTLGRRLGDPAILRVGGVEVARGELVQVDGEIGVRIAGRSAHGGV